MTGQILDHILHLQHHINLYEVIRRKNATHRHLQWYSSCHLLCWVAILSSVVLAILNPYWNLEGSFCPVLLMGHLHDVYWVNRYESTNLSTSSVLFLLLFSKFTSLNNCKYTHYLHHWLVWTCIGRETSHTRMFQAQCAYILPTVALMRASFLNVIKKLIYLNTFVLFFLLCSVGCQAITEQTHCSLWRVQNGWGGSQYVQQFQ